LYTDRMKVTQQQIADLYFPCFKSLVFRKTITIELH
jgi:hypothetical protein